MKAYVSRETVYRKPSAHTSKPGGNPLILKKAEPFNLLPSPKALNSYILYYNVVFPDGDVFAPQYTLMPNACGTLSLAFDGSAVIAELWGASLTPFPLGAEPNRYRALLLIRLSPYGLYQITGQDQSELADKRLSLADIDGGLFKSLRKAFMTSNTVKDLVGRCDGVFYSRTEKRVVSDALLCAADLISKRHGRVKVRDVARQVCYSERHLNRFFMTQIGTSIKKYARLARFHYVLSRMQKTPCLFAALSQQAGYFDQAHFDKDFKAIGGVSPQKYLETSDFYYDGTEDYPIISSKEE